MITGKVLLSLKRKGWKFKVRWMQKNQGLCSYKKKTLSLNAYVVLASVIIHEATHAVHDYLPEEMVEGVENYERGQLTLKRAKGIVKAFCPDIYKAMNRR